MNLAQKIQLGSQLEEVEKAKAQERMEMRTGGLTKEKLPESVDKGQTRDKIGERLGISGKSVLVYVLM